MGYKSSVTGEVVSEEFAKANPDTTYRDSRLPGGKKTVAKKKKETQKPEVKKSEVASKPATKTEEPKPRPISLDKAAQRKEALLPGLRAKGKETTVTVARVEEGGREYAYILKVMVDGTYDTWLE